MSDSTFSAEDYNLGDRVVNYALRLFSWGIAIAVAWSCSSLLLSIILFIIVGLLLELLSYVLSMALLLKAPDKVETLGRFVGQTTGRVSSMFTRKEPAHA